MKHFAPVMRNAASLFSAQFVTKFSTLAVTILIAHALHPAGFGRYAAALSYGALVGVLADGGLAYFISVEVARRPLAGRGLFWTAYGTRTALSALLLGASVLLLPVFRFAGETALAAIVMGVAACFDGLTAQALAFFRARAQMHVEAQIVTAGRIMLVAATVVVVLAAPSLLSVSLAACTGSVFTAFTALWFVARRAGPQWPRRRATLALLKAALPFAASGLLMYVFFRIDVLLLRLFGIADAMVGYYSAAYRIMEAPRSAFGSIAAGVLPAATQLAKNNERGELVALVGRSTGFALWLVVPAALLFAISPATFIELIFGRGYSAAIPLLAIMAPMPLLMTLNAVAVSLINALGAQVRVTAVFALCAAGNIALNVALIPVLGATGAAIATVATEAFELALFARWIQSRVGGVRIADLSRIALAGCAGTCAGVLVPPVAHGVPRAVCALAVYAAVAAVLIGRRRFAFA